MKKDSRFKNQKFAVISTNHSVIPAPGFRRGQAPAGIQGHADYSSGNTLDPRFRGGDKKVVFYVSVLLFSFSPFLLVHSSVFAANNVPAVDLNSPSFHLLQCDGPDLSGLPKDTKITIYGKSYTIEGQNPIITNADGSNSHQYQPCNFQGLMIEVQYLLNVMTIVAVLAAIVGFAYAGYLYITGTQENLKKARSMFPKLAIGFILILTAWFIVYQILAWLTGNAGAAALLGNGS